MPPPPAPLPILLPRSSAKNIEDDQKSLLPKYVRELKRLRAGLEEAAAARYSTPTRTMHHPILSLALFSHHLFFLSSSSTTTVTIISVIVMLWTNAVCWS